MRNQSGLNLTLPTTTDPKVIVLNAENSAWLVIAMLILVTNLFVLSIILIRKNLRNPSNAILCSMFICGCTIPIVYIFPGRVFEEWRFQSIFLCSTSPSFAFASITCYNLHICGICLDKMMSILTPFRHRILSNTRNIAILIAAFWIIPYVTGFIPLYTYRPYSSQFCVYDNRSHQIIQNDQIFQTIFFVTLIFIPMLTTIMLYSVALVKINRKSGSKILADAINQTVQKSNLSRNLKVLRQLFFVLGLFAICWLPFFILFVVQQYYFNETTRLVYSVFRYLALTYPIINPALVSFFTSSIRDEIMYLFNLRTKEINFSSYPRIDHLSRNVNYQVHNPSTQTIVASTDGLQNTHPIQWVNTETQDDDHEEMLL
ncbi:Beta-2 adrenergic receptor [Trichoplax sp. H2]|nr:Beta-2 adrenergic receptor [Trichoplax sp. H2]|eukprot:RDD42859.1 Beta-2 adrenergic receptor [Trichoplax sp. H2]